MMLLSMYLLLLVSQPQDCQPVNLFTSLQNLVSSSHSLVQHLRQSIEKQSLRPQPRLLNLQQPSSGPCSPEEWATPCAPAAPCPPQGRSPCEASCPDDWRSRPPTAISCPSCNCVHGEGGGQFYYPSYDIYDGIISKENGNKITSDTAQGYKKKSGSGKPNFGDSFVPGSHPGSGKPAFGNSFVPGSHPGSGKPAFGSSFVPGSHPGSGKPNFGSESQTGGGGRPNYNGPVDSGGRHPGGGRPNYDDDFGFGAPHPGSGRPNYVDKYPSSVAHHPGSGKPNYNNNGDHDWPNLFHPSVSSRPLQFPCSPTFPPWYLVPACCHCDAQTWSPVVPPTSSPSPTFPPSTTESTLTSRPTFAPPPPDHCLVLLTAAIFSISKPEADLCELAVIAMPNSCRLELTFETFWLADSPGCASEFLDIEGRRYCGQLPAGLKGKPTVVKGEKIL